MITARRQLWRIKLCLALILGLNTIFWCGSKDMYARWAGVPPVPSYGGAVALTLGDPQFSYRFLGIVLQNLGNVGRDTAPLKAYDYSMLGQWFFLLHKLDAASDHLPMIAAYYFGGTRVPKDIGVVVEYLRVAGAIPVGEKWRWLAHAAYLAQHRMHDVSLALSLAYQLSKMPNSAEMPQWARQMPAFILAKKGDREAARELMANMLLTEQATPPAEVNYMREYLVTELGMTSEEVEKIMRMRAGQ